MDIRNTKELKAFAAQRLEQAQNGKRIVLIYSGLVLGLGMLVTLVNYLLQLQISQSGGLGNMGTRSILSTVQALLPVARMVVVLCIDLGYIAAMLRIARGQYVSAQTLRLGFDRFWPLLRLMLIKGLIFFGIGFASVYAATFIYMLTPLSDPAMELLMPIVNRAGIMDPTLLLDDATYLQLMSAMAPVMAIFGLIYCVLAIPVAYQYRMSEYILIDQPGQGAMAALRESRKMMRNNRFRLFRMDLSLWWYYAATLGAMVVCYGDQILPMLGIPFPWSGEVSYFLFYAIYLVLQFAIYYCLRSRVEVAYALAYDALRPQDKPDNGVVLGNIFNM